MSSLLSATSAPISPSYSKSTPLESRIPTASCTRWVRSPGGWPKLEKASMDARFEPQSPRHSGGFNRDVREILGGRHFGDRSGDHDCAAAREDERDSDDAMTRLVVDHAPHFLERDREVAGDARHHRVCVAPGDHRSAEGVAVLIDQPLTIAQQVALALQSFVEELRVNCVAL